MSNNESKNLDQCIEEILKQRKLSSVLRVWKSRLRHGNISHETKEKMVKEAGYVLVQEAKYAKKNP